MGCDVPYYPRSPLPWDVHGIAYDEWFELFPVALRGPGRSLTCGICGAKVADKGARIHRDWHRRNA